MRAEGVMNKTLFLIFILLSVRLRAHATDKPQMAVRFTIVATAYRQHFGTSVGSVESAAANAVVQALKEHIQFVDFAAPADGQATYTLTVSLAVPDPNTDVAAQPVWLVASLAGPHETPALKRR